MNAKKVKDLIGNDLWNSNSTAVVKVAAFDAAEQAILKLKTPEEKADFRELCALDSEDNGQVRLPILPRYLRSVCGKHPVDDRYILGVFDDYYHDNKWDEVFFLGKKILSFNESPYILKALAEAYEFKGDEENKIYMWERLAKADHSETEVFYKLAQHYEKTSNPQMALNCYRRAIIRHINASQLDAIKNIWPMIVALKIDQTDYLAQLAEKTARAMGGELAVSFLIDIYGTTDFDLNSKIRLLKIILDYDTNNAFACEHIVALFREKYADNPRLDFCLENTGILYNYMNANLAVQKFEKEIEFVENAFVWHNTWHLGRIRKIEQDEIYIQFITRKDLHKMSCDMAFSSLRVLPKKHIRVLKAGAKPEQIREKLLSDVAWGVEMMFNSFNDQVTLKQMKEELVPSVLTESDWTEWQKKAKKELVSNPYYCISDDNANVYERRDTPMSFEEKQLRNFQREKTFFGRYSVLKDLIRQNGDTDSEEFSKMIGYFENELKSDSEYALCSFIIIDSLGYGHTDTDFEQLYEGLSTETRTKVYDSIDDAELRRVFIDCVMKYDEAWQTSLVPLLYSSPSTYLLSCIADGPKKRVITDVLTDAVQNCTANPDLSLFLFKNYTDKDWENARFTREEIITSKLSLLMNIGNKVSHEVDTQNNKARMKVLVDDLFGKNTVKDYLSDCETAQARRIVSYIENNPALDEKYWIETKHFILTNRSDNEQILGKAEEPISESRLIPKGFLCTRKMFIAKTQELDHVMNVEIPENSKEIGTARDLGDLRENAEYQYAKDKQKNLNALMNTLTNEIDMAKIIDPEDVDLNYVEFGTKATFKDNLNNCQVVHTIFGQWEANPEKNILNFQAPLVQKLYNMTLGENKKFEINGIKYDLTVEKIELADFDLK